MRSVRDSLRRGWVRVLALMLTDAAVLLLSMTVSMWAYRVFALAHYRLEFYLRLWPMPIAYVLVNSAFRLYHGSPFHPASPLSPPEEWRRLVSSSLIVHVGTLAALALAFQTTDGYSRVAISLSGFVLALLSQPARDLVRALMKRLDVGQIPVTLVGDPSLCATLSRILSTDAALGFSPCGDASADLVVVCGQRQNREVERLLHDHPHVVLLPDRASFPVAESRTVDLGDLRGLEIESRRAMRAVRAQKRVLDCLLCAVAFVFALPFFVVVPLLIKLTSPGPVFYKAKRLGKRGRPIEVYKFRSMYADADQRLQSLLASDPRLRDEFARGFKLRHDPRVTPFGRILRKTSIDELPQFFNVFRGDMALIGPRPIVEAERERYGEDFALVSSVRPGITGLWQVSGRSDCDYANRVALDMRYVLNWSPWLDLWILRKTFGAVLLMRGSC